MNRRSFLQSAAAVAVGAVLPAASVAAPLAVEGSGFVPVLAYDGLTFTRDPSDPLGQRADQWREMVAMGILKGSA